MSQFSHINKVGGPAGLSRPIVIDVGDLAGDLSKVQISFPKGPSHSHSVNEAGPQRDRAVSLRLVNPQEEWLKLPDRLPVAAWEVFAQKLARYQFSEEHCPHYKERAPNFLSDYVTRLLLRREQRLFLRSERKISSGPQFIAMSACFETANCFLLRHRDDIRAFEVATKEPIFGHGALRINSIFVNSDGEIGASDAGLKHCDRICPRRVEALALRTDLEFSGRAEEAARFWEAYDAEYNAQLDRRGIELTPEIKRGKGALDLLATFYFSSIAVRESDPVTAPFRREEAADGLVTLANTMSLLSQD